jgi:hypothetical protein
MGDKVKLTVEQILDVNEAVGTIGEKETLSATVGYRLGRLKKYAESIAKQFAKTKQKKIDAYNKEVTAPGLTEEQKLAIRRKLDAELEELLEQVEEIKLPELKLSDFMDEKGKLLVPQKFLSLMGDLVKDDKNTGDYSTLAPKMEVLKEEVDA